MDSFAKVHFKGRFRDYQQRILDNSDSYLKDGKINIVAAPGSGKTVLGLELIRRLGTPCLILSPTTAIRQQWGDRLREMFLDDNKDFFCLFSADLHDIKLINSSTYQALYSAMEKVSDNSGEESFTDVDIVGIMRNSGIKTVCLDEAHHLRNEWQRSLEKFIAALDKDVKIISLTATPPYDAEGAEWSRYKNICGEIDEEIFVPELVGQNTLCPHQDYVFFNYPTKTEAAAFAEHRKRATAALEALRELDVFSRISIALNNEKDYDALFSDAGAYVALAVMLKYLGSEPDKKLINILTAKRGLPRFEMKYAETAIQFLLDGDLISEEDKAKITSTLKSCSVYEKGKAVLNLNEKLKRTLISSVGKLESIKSIVKSEVYTMKDRLRMLILTDYIKKESLPEIASTEKLTSVNVVSIFESLRRSAPNVNMCVLSGSLVIIPNSIEPPDFIRKNKNIASTDYCVAEFTGPVCRVVNYVGQLFERGEIQILIGTKSLLGEGWDSPCINSLILASFVGSFVLSNQMRGRAIRIDKNNPDKTANIWHLVTLEPEYMFKDKVREKVTAYVNEDYSRINSYDYEILKRRFDTFMGPNYESGTIESGIERISIIKPPFDETGIERINREMLALSGRRDDVREKWHGEVANGSFAVVSEEDIRREARVPVFGFYNLALSFLLLLAEVLLIRPLFVSVQGDNLFLLLAALTAMTVFAAVLFTIVKEMIIHFNPANSIKVLGKAIYETLTECNLVSGSAKVEVTEHKGLSYVSLRLRNASVRDQNIFNSAMAELLSPIENPRYLLIGRTLLNRRNYTLSFACPSVIGKRKEYAEVLTNKLKNTTGKFEAVFTRREDGRKLILKCRKYSYITLNENISGRKYRISHWN